MDRNALMQRYWDSLAPAAPRQQYGGVLDQLGIVPPQQDTPDRNGLMDRVGQGAALLDHWTMGIPTTVAGLVNSAIPGQPLGDMWSIKDNAETARSDLARSGYGDFLALPDAFAGSVPGGVGHGARRDMPAAARPDFEPYRVLNRVEHSSVVPSEFEGGARVYRGTKRENDGFNVSGVIDNDAVYASTKPESARLYGQYVHSGIANPKTPYIVDGHGTIDTPSSAWLKANGHDAVIQKFGDENHYVLLQEGLVHHLDTSTLGPAYDAGGAVPHGKSNASAYLDLFGAGTRQAGRLAESAIDPIYQAMPSNAVGSAGGKLGPQLSDGALSPKGITAYHGSPHDFDRFDLSKIGSGAGGNMHGTGINATENKKMAEQFSEIWNDNDELVGKGKTYELRLNAKPSEIVDLDKEMSDQNQIVIDKLARAGYYNPSDFGESSVPKKEHGIKMGRYRVGRNESGRDSYNYVIYDTDIIDIVNKYGIAAAASMYGMDQVSQAMADQDQPRNALMPSY